ncbi:MAG: hypothetical protein ACRDU4_15645, partial [Mycobacterium sp.]
SCGPTRRTSSRRKPPVAPSVLAAHSSEYLICNSHGYATGARLTEKYMKGRPGFDEYQARTSFFVPRPPRSARR